RERERRRAAKGNRCGREALVNRRRRRRRHRERRGGGVAGAAVGRGDRRGGVGLGAGGGAGYGERESTAPASRNACAPKRDGVRARCKGAAALRDPACPDG